MAQHRVQYVRLVPFLLLLAQHRVHHAILLLLAQHHAIYVGLAPILILPAQHLRVQDHQGVKYVRLVPFLILGEQHHVPHVLLVSILIGLMAQIHVPRVPKVPILILSAHHHVPYVL